MKKYLVPFDGSDSARRALRHAAALAKRLGASLHIVHAHEKPLYYGELAVYVPRGRFEKLQRDHSRSVLDAAEKEMKGRRVRYAREVLIGPAAETIVRKAAALGCDGIIMGTRGLGAVGNLVMGSVTTKVLHLARMPVTLVR
jgi:nucleotide-binding universal stress UspA family protein